MNSLLTNESRPIESHSSPMRATAKVPGKLMIAGEYAVLAGRPALATTLDQHLTVRCTRGKALGATSLQSDDILVASDLWSASDLTHVSSPDEKDVSRGDQGTFLGYWVNPVTGIVRAYHRHDKVRFQDLIEPDGELIGTGVSEGIYDGLKMSPPPSHLPLIQAVLRGARTFGIKNARVHVSSELDVSHGFGSSSALYLGVMAAMGALSQSMGAHGYPGPQIPPWVFNHQPRGAEHATGNFAPDFERLLGLQQTNLSQLLWGIARLAFGLQWDNQKRGSGYDVITQLVGGLVLSQPFQADEAFPDCFVSSQSHQASPQSRHEILTKWPASVDVLNGVNPAKMSQYIHLFVGGKGALTGPLVRSTVGWMQESEQRGFLKNLCIFDDQVQKAALTVLNQTGNCPALLKDLLGAVRQHREWLKKMPQYPKLLTDRLDQVPGCDKTWTYKTTGAGGEDALLIWGELEQLGEASQTLRQLGWKRLNVGFDRFGMKLQVESKNLSMKNRAPSRNLGIDTTI